MMAIREVGLFGLRGKAYPDQALIRSHAGHAYGKIGGVYCLNSSKAQQISEHGSTAVRRSFPQASHPFSVSRNPARHMGAFREVGSLLGSGTAIPAGRAATGHGVDTRWASRRRLWRIWRPRACCGQRSTSAIRSWRSETRPQPRSPGCRWRWRDFARSLDVPVELVPFDTAGQVVAALAKDVWDVGFLAIDPVRASEIAFTPPYVIIEGSYLVRGASQLRAIGDVDRDGIRIAAGKNSAYDRPAPSSRRRSFTRRVRARRSTCF